jgi:hypothetical protein
VTNRVGKSVLFTLIFITYLLSFPILCLSGEFKCTRVTDDDTITVTQIGFKTTIRLVGIDAPEKSRKKHEPGQPFSLASTKYLAGMILNKDVDIKRYGTDRYLPLFLLKYVRWFLRCKYIKL